MSFAGMTLNKTSAPSFGSGPHVRIKEPFSSFHSAKTGVCSLSSRDHSDRDVRRVTPVQIKDTWLRVGFHSAKPMCTMYACS